MDEWDDEDHTPCEGQAELLLNIEMGDLIILD